MKKSTCFIGITLFWVCQLIMVGPLWGQVSLGSSNYLLSLEKGNKRIIFSKGQLLKFTLKDDPIRYNGHIAQINPGFVWLNFGHEESIPVALPDFDTFYMERNSRLAGTFRKLGFILPLSGLIFFGLDAINTSRRPEANFNWKSAAQISAGLCGAGLVMIIGTRQKRMKTGRKWSLKVVNPDNYRYRKPLPAER
jgi:hypothetical protein